MVHCCEISEANSSKHVNNGGPDLGPLWHVLENAEDVLYTRVDRLLNIIQRW